MPPAGRHHDEKPPAEGRNKKSIRFYLVKVKVIEGQITATGKSAEDVDYAGHNLRIAIFLNYHIQKSEILVEAGSLYYRKLADFFYDCICLLLIDFL